MPAASSFGVTPAKRSAEPGPRRMERLRIAGSRIIAALVRDDTGRWVARLELRAMFPVMTPSPHLRALCDAALDLAKQAPWSTIGLGAIARQASVTLASCAQEGITKASIADALDAKLDQAMLAEAEIIDQSQVARDRLFEVVMARFDAMEDHRPAWTSILKADARAPLAALSRVSRRARAAAWALEAAGIVSNGVRGGGRVAGLARILRLVEGAWLKDGPDLSGTMATLDQNLRSAEQMVLQIDGLMGRLSRQDAAAPSPNSATPEDAQTL